MKYQFIAQHHQQFCLSLLCQTLEVSRSGYYAWCKRPLSQQAQANHHLVERIRIVHTASYGTYGSPRIWAELRAQGVGCSLNRVARLMRAHAIRARGKKRRVVTTQADPSQLVAPNRLDRQFEARTPNQKWLTDITYIPTDQGWLYLAGVLDLYARKIVGWAIEPTLTTRLVTQALTMAIQTRQPGTGLLHHSDRGSQYTSIDYQSLLTDHRFQVSMSRAGNCYDNAPMESFFGTLKSEWVDQRHYRTFAEAKTDIFAYIEGFYNRRRRHSALDYLSPEAYEQAYYLSLN
jgi:putative transposase